MNYSIIKIGSGTRGHILVGHSNKNLIESVVYSEIALRIVKNVDDIYIGPAYDWDPVTEEYIKPINVFTKDMVIMEFGNDLDSASLYFKLTYNIDYDVRTNFVIRNKI